MKAAISVLSIVICLFVLLFSCKKSESEIRQSLRVTDFTKSGEVHNEFLTNVLVNFELPRDRDMTLDKKTDYVYEFNRAYAHGCERIINPSIFELSMKEHKHLVQMDELVFISFSLSIDYARLENEELNVFESLDFLRSNDLVSDFWYFTLYGLCDDVRANYMHELSDEELEYRIRNYVAAYEDHQYSTQSGEGEALGEILAITIASIEWWKTNPDAYNGFLEGQRIAPWAAADIVGACWGGCTGAIGSYVTGGEVNWGAVGIGALSGAIAGSTGAIGKIAKWLS